jgi:histidinol dehydrogenase
MKKAHYSSISLQFSLTKSTTTTMSKISSALRFLKKPSLANGVTSDPVVNVAKIVTGVINDIRSNGDTAVRTYSEKFDKWTPKSFRLSPNEINNIVSKVPKSTLDDIITVQDSVRKFALAQRATIQDLEMELRPGVTLGHKNIPIGSVGA